MVDTLCSLAKTTGWGPSSAQDASFSGAYFSEIEGRPFTDTSQVFASDLNAPVEFDGLDAIWQSIFISSDIPKSVIDRYGMIRR